MIPLGCSGFIGLHAASRYQYQMQFNDIQCGNGHRALVKLKVEFDGLKFKIH